MPFVTRIEASGLAGYRKLLWSDLRPDMNLLVGRNAVGKSTLLEALVVCLNFAYGKRSGDLLTGAARDARLAIEFSDGRRIENSLGNIHGAQTPRGSRRVENVLYVQEGRRPKNRLGRGRRELTQHPSNRYDALMSDVQARLRGTPEERESAMQLFDYVKRLKHAGREEDWDRMRLILGDRGVNGARPISCGQYDVLSLILDLLQMRDALEGSDLTPFVLIDNLETFAHPALQTELVSQIRSILPKAQVFLATHSMKLIAHAEPGAVFWLSRERVDREGCVEVEAVDELSPDRAPLFFELYGDDTSSAVLTLVSGLASTEYVAFLCACVLPCGSIERAAPEKDIQVRSVIEELREFSGEWTLVDVGAGTGDLLEGLIRLHVGGPGLEYVAVDHCPSGRLEDRIKEAKKKGLIAATSRTVASFEQAPDVCDAVAFVNTCHALGVDLVAQWLSLALSRLRRSPQSCCVIHEAEVLKGGEKAFIMWMPDDFIEACRGITGLKVRAESLRRAQGVPVHTAIFTLGDDFEPAGDLSERIRTGLVARLWDVLKRSTDERWGIAEGDQQDHTLSAAVKQRRRAFFTEQAVNAVEELSKRGMLVRAPQGVK